MYKNKAERERDKIWHIFLSSANRLQAVRRKEEEKKKKKEEEEEKVQPQKQHKFKATAIGTNISPYQNTNSFKKFDSCACKLEIPGHHSSLTFFVYYTSLV